MSQSSNGRSGGVIGPGGRPLTLEDLPPPETKRWVSRRKAEVVTAVRAGLLTLEDACRRYNLSVEEFLSWQRLIEHHGVAGLRATRLQDYRREPRGDGAAAEEPEDTPADDDTGSSFDAHALSGGTPQAALSGSAYGDD